VRERFRLEPNLERLAAKFGLPLAGAAERAAAA